MGSRIIQKQIVGDQSHSMFENISWRNPLISFTVWLTGREKVGRVKTEEIEH